MAYDADDDGKDGGRQACGRGRFGEGGMNLADASRKTADGLEVDVIVSPRSDRSRPEGFDEWRKRLIVRIKAPPLDGKANKEVESLFKDLTGFRSEIVSGRLNRTKTVLIRGDADKIEEILGRSV
ncbi:MAG: DUF167 family protein [Candidatus Methanoplasma sp.]|jgi:uncharacterized protein (TIGR00251 family)|nr:DUF167 family protein [Candidatus Methanoplasma sp.]